MAYIGKTTDNGSFYNVNYSVGSNASNKRDDVFLVQWMLHRVYTDHPMLSPPEVQCLEVDGWIGPQSVKWIKAFQSDMRRAGRTCMLDSRIDSARNVTGAVSKVPYTILWLNAVFFAANPQIYTDPANDPEAPLELLIALATNTGAAGPFDEQPMAIPSSGGI